MYLAVASCLLWQGAPSAPSTTRRPRTPAAYKELTPDDYKNTDGWKVAQPKDDALRGKWWEIFNDPAVECAGREGECFKSKYRRRRGKLFCGAGPGQGSSIAAFPYRDDQPIHHRATAIGDLTSIPVRQGREQVATAHLHEAHLPTTRLPFDATWQPDLFGRIRNTVNAAAYGAQASAADLENTRLTVQADLADGLFSIFAGRMR